ncbi:hypothetical protein GCM10007242_16470 [Pigmentiphaga litoralis]|uniref:carboxypeptidase-like regulatory domain-containing protein n=1 Tax=Pigmentiphaga litoralis TaxID=516702 RepID=UPI001676FD53|nr:carboxypeptidase-like regulatory domain-containing protein [Pigmentiphaga litoralis]GGX11122.1 hypothetical protein GCM10007242_16470 [Pigmentiphaga litoralis]
MKIALTIALTLGLAACAMPPQRTTVTRLPFNEAEYASLAKTGTGVVRGQLFAKQRGGGVVKGAGSEILLNPVTSLSLQWYDAVRAGNMMSEPDPRYMAATRTTRADAEGRFEFRAVPPGEYFVTGAVSWEVPQIGVQGGAVVERVKVQDAATSDVVLAR